MNDAAESGLPLAGLRVLELGTMTAGPFAATLLGDFGAEIIKLEAPAGDPARYVEPRVDGQSLYWAVDARNKRSVVCDLRDAADRQAFLALIPSADVVIENFRPGTLEKWGVGPDVLHGINPRLVLVRVSGYGQTGERASLPAYDRVIQAISGYAHTNGSPGTPPTVVGNFVSDYTTAVFAALGCLIALHALKNGAPGQVVDVSSLETMIRLSEIDVSLYSATGEVRPRLGNGHMAAAPMNAYETQDGSWLMIHVPTDRMFDRLLLALGMQELADDPRFNTSSARVTNRDDLDALLAEWFRTRDCSDAMTHLDSQGVPAGKMSDASDVVGDQLLHERKALIEAESPIGTLLMPGVIPRLTATPGSVRSGAPSELGPRITAFMQEDDGKSGGTG